MSRGGKEPGAGQHGGPLSHSKKAGSPPPRASAARWWPICLFGVRCFGLAMETPSLVMLRAPFAAPAAPGGRREQRRGRRGPGPGRDSASRGFGQVMAAEPRLQAPEACAEGRMLPFPSLPGKHPCFPLPCLPGHPTTRRRTGTGTCPAWTKPASSWQSHTAARR